MPKVRRSLSVVLSVCALSLLSVVSASAQEWTRFRGPNGTGLGKAANLPVSFTEKDCNWKVALPGEGHSSPVLWGKRIFLTSAEQGKRHLLCLNAPDGKTLWTKSYDFASYRMHQFNTAASATPTVDKDRVYVLWPANESFLVVALTHSGEEVWRRDFGRFPTQHGGAPSPILHDGLLIFAMEPEDSSGALVALDAKTGETRWKKDRPSRAAPYAVPLLYQPKIGPAELIFTSTAHGFTSLDPKTGAVKWELPGVFRARCVSSPVQLGDLILQTAGTGGGEREAVAVRPLGGGKAEVVYKMPPRGVSYVPTPLLVGENLFLWGDGGIVVCVKPATGEILWQERVGGNYFGSPICADGKIWAMSAKGELVVLAASGMFKELGRVDLGEPSHSTPAVADGVLYLRTRSHLFSVGGGAKKAAVRR
jgi:outer membrane protein assembly factor BamB